VANNASSTCSHSSILISNASWGVEMNI
jgi:hypothetical protein